MKTLRCQLWDVSNVVIKTVGFEYKGSSHVMGLDAGIKNGYRTNPNKTQPTTSTTSTDQTKWQYFDSEQAEINLFNKIRIEKTKTKTKNNNRYVSMWHCTHENCLPTPRLLSTCRYKARYHARGDPPKGQTLSRPCGNAENMVFVGSAGVDV